MKYDAKRRAYVLSPEEVENLNATMEEARALAEILEARTRFGWPTIPTQGGKKLLN